LRIEGEPGDSGEDDSSCPEDAIFPPLPRQAGKWYTSVQSLRSQSERKIDMNQRELIHRSSMKVSGIETRTTNKDETDSDIAKIPLLWQRFFQENIREKIPNKVQSGHVLAVYTDYESDEHGPYTVILGCEVSSIEDVPKGMVAKVLPESTYVRFTTQNGPVTTVISQAWKEIWQLQPSQLGGTRRFSADFEVHDERSLDPQNTTVDIYLAIR